MKLHRLVCRSCGWEAFRNVDPQARAKKPICPECRGALTQTEQTGPATMTAPNGKRLSWDYDNQRWSPA